jgi:2-polyprenyl-3-methyl-5-hydroxy-6-metoxy-1,4-benzoquinol methylase
MKANRKFESNRENLHYVGERIVPSETPAYLFYEHLSRYSFAGKFVERKSVCEVGCGVGVGSDYLLKKGAAFLVSGDISCEALTFLKDHYKQGKLYSARLSATFLPLKDEQFDVVVAFEVIEHIRDYENLVLECKRVLKKGGLFICSTPNKRIDLLWRSRAQGEFHVHEFFPEEIFELISGSFNKVTMYGQSPTTFFRRVSLSLLGLFSKVLLCFPNGLFFREQFVKILRKMVNIANKEFDFSNDEIKPQYLVSAFQDNCSYVILLGRK